tara:strand:- start:544 stop:1392 length:849 start_codon:yes stop_codon:yes gene_type:complete
MIPLIINLPKSKERREKIPEKLKPYFVSHVLLEGIDGLSLREDEYRKSISQSLDIPDEKLKPSYFYERKNFQSYGRDEDTILKKVGCFLSHLNAIRFAFNNNLFNVLILEDDFKINENIFKVNINQSSGLITYFGGQGKGAIPAENNSFIDLKDFELFGTYGYLIKTKTDMEYILNLMRSCFNDGPGRIKLKDDFHPSKDRLKMMSIDLWYKRFLHKKCVCAYPIIVEHDDEVDSTIDTSKKYKKRYGNKCISKLIKDSQRNQTPTPSTEFVNDMEPVLIQS